MRVAFALVAHLPNDERVWFQQAKSLQEAGYETFIVSTRTNNCSLANSYCFDDTAMPKRKLIEKLASILLSIIPDVLICDNPIAILAAQRYNKKIGKQVRIMYDITEWYPSKKNLRGLPLWKKVVKAPLLIFLSFYAARFLDGFIFGEQDKAKPFRFFFPWKKFIYLPYYADSGLVKTYPVKNLSKECVFFYAGNLTEEKGFDTVFNVALKCAFHFPETKFILRIVSNDNPDRLPTSPTIANLEIQKLATLPFLSFCEEIGKADIFFDLRKMDVENMRCLPIKLFYYMAAGRPVIYSNLKAIQKAVPEIHSAGMLVDSKDTSAIVAQIARYLQDEKYYQGQCISARQLAEQKYNWATIEPLFVDFIGND
jgi:glycosyltransferase involved in cell wall biosynthesis